MTLEPEKFRLSLERPSQPGHLKPDAEAVCLVTASDSFTPQVQENIKFSISRWETGVPGKIPVPIRQDLCCLSDDLRHFRIGFNLVAPGPYRVMVRLGRGHIAESPLKFTVHGSDSLEVDGGGDVCGGAGAKADRGDVLDEILAKHVVHDVNSKRDFENNNNKVKSGKEDTSKTVNASVVWDGQQEDGAAVVHSSTTNASKTHLPTPSEFEGKSDPTDLIDFSCPLQSTATFFKTPEQSLESLEVDSEPSFDEMPSFDLSEGNSEVSKVKEGESIWVCGSLGQVGELRQPKATDGNGNWVLGEKMESKIQSKEFEERNMKDEMGGREVLDDVELHKENAKQRAQEDQKQKVQEDQKQKVQGDQKQKVQEHQKVQEGQGQRVKVNREPLKCGQKVTEIRKEDQQANKSANGEKDRVYLGNLMKEWREVSQMEVAVPLTVALVEQEIERVGKMLTQVDLNSNLPISSDLEYAGHSRVPATEEGETMGKVPSILEGARRLFSIPMSRNPGGKNPDQSLMAPIGFCVLQNGNIAVASTFDHKVKLFNPKGVFIAEVKAVGGNFERPSDMFTLTSGDFLVRDNTRLILFSGGQEKSTGMGTFVAELWQEETGSDSKYSGLAEDEEGRVVTIKESKSEDTELLFFDLKSKRVTRRLGIGHALTDGANSKCRFLAIKRGKFYISDLGLHHIYVIDSRTGLLLLKVGKLGSEAGCLDNPAGLAVDGEGNMLVADSKNHRISVFSPKGDFLGLSKLPEVKRPSSLLLEPNTNQLIVLNLAGYTGLVKYRLGRR